MRVLMCILALMAAMTAHAAAPASDCLSDFLSRDGDWQARTFDGRAVDAAAFVPVNALFVRNGHVHSATWQSEPASARVKQDGNAILLKLFYPAALPGIDDAGATRLQPYAQAEHRLVIQGECKSPRAVTIEIRGAGLIHSVGLVRVPTSAAEFQEPANWNW